MAAYTGGYIKHCCLSVCLSVRHHDVFSSIIFSKLESREKFKHSGEEIILETSRWWSNSMSKGQLSRSLDKIGMKM